MAKAYERNKPAFGAACVRSEEVTARVAHYQVRASRLRLPKLAAAVVGSDAEMELAKWRERDRKIAAEITSVVGSIDRGTGKAQDAANCQPSKSLRFGIELTKTPNRDNEEQQWI